MSVPGAGDRPREGRNPPPVEEAGSRHLPNPRPSVHNAPRLLRRRCSGRRGGTRLQLCTREGGNLTEDGDGHVTAGVQGKDGGLRGAEGVLVRAPRPRPRVTWLVLAPWTRDFRVEGNFLPTSLPSPSRASSFLFAGEDNSVFLYGHFEHLGCAGESDPLKQGSPTPRPQTATCRGLLGKGPHSRG